MIRHELLEFNVEHLIERFIQASHSNVRFKRTGYGTGTGIPNGRFNRK
jgi:hypothetical protein